VSPVPAVPVLATKILAAAPRHYVHRAYLGRYRGAVHPLVVYPVGPLSKTFHRRPGLFVKPAWMLTSREFLSIAADYAPDVILLITGSCRFRRGARRAQLEIPFHHRA